MEPSKKKLGLVLSGGGARGAYEAGVLHYIRTQMPKSLFKESDFRVICGSSVGAITASFMAATAHDLSYQGEHLYHLWANLNQDNIYKRDVLSFAGLVTYSFYAISKSVFARKLHSEKASQNQHFRGLLNTTPFVPFLKKIIPWNQIALNIKHNIIDALSITATNMTSGQLELFIEKSAELPYTGRYTHHVGKIEFHHAMASAAIPLMFPSVKIGKRHYADGGLRANTPMSPSIQLGADHIMVIGTHHESERPEELSTSRFIETDNPPSLGLVLGKILSTIFIDRLDYDIEQMNRINRIISWGESCFGDDFVQKINTHLQQNSIQGDIASRGLKKLSVLSLQPSIDLRSIFYDTVDRTDFFKKGLKSFERTILKVLDVDLESSQDFLSFIIFYPKYLKALLELGFQDAKNQHDKIEGFFVKSRTSVTP